MCYEINPKCYRQVFVLPKEIVEKHIKLAGALQLKVLLWIFYHDGVCDDITVLADALGASASDVQDALQYWLVNDLICCNNDGNYAASDAKEAALSTSSPKQAVPIRPPVRAQKPNRTEVARRGKESPEISWLLCEAQNKFKRSLSFAESSTLVWLMDTYGMSPAIIIMVIEYALSIDCCNIKFIENTAIQWAKAEIDTVEKAEQHLTQLEQTRTEWHTVCRVFGLERRKPSKQEETYIARWMREWSLSTAMLQAAYDQCVNNTGKVSFAYINKVLEQWHKAGYQKPEEIQQKSGTVAKSGRTVKRASASNDKSYDIDEIEQFILNQ